MIIAIATDDGKNLIKRHFGDANQYLLYDIKETGSVFLKKIDNAIEVKEDETHGDPRKSKSVQDLLGVENVRIVANRAFGANIQRIKKHFVCVVSSENTVSETLDLCRRNFRRIHSEWEKGESRNYLRI